MTEGVVVFGLSGGGCGRSVTGFVDVLRLGDGLSAFDFLVPLKEEEDTEDFHMTPFLFPVDCLFAFFLSIDIFN